MKGKPAQTSNELSSIAGAILRQGNPFESEKARQSMVQILIAHRRVGDTPEEIANGFLDAIRPILEPYFKNTQMLAASCLRQDETRGKR